MASKIRRRRRQALRLTRYQPPTHTPKGIFAHKPHPSPQPRVASVGSFLHSLLGHVLYSTSHTNLFQV